MLSVGLLVGQLTAGLRFAAGISTSRERRAQSLFELTRELSAALESAQVVEHGTASVQRHFGGQALIIVTDSDDRLTMPSITLDGFDPSVADWAYRQGQSAGMATNTLAAQPWHYVPLKAPMRVRGVLAICPAHPRWLLIPEQYQQLDTLARQIAIALERVHYVEVAQKAVVDMESERLRTTLLAAISHDVRTPLTALIGMAESLEFGTSDERMTTTRALIAQARELNALVNNLLDMARLEAGAVEGNVQLRKEWHSVEEVVGSAIRSAGPSLNNQPVKTSLPSDLPLVEFDAVLIERVLVNLLGNAAKYGSPPITVSAFTTANKLSLTVHDCGAGIPVEMLGSEQFLFEKFTRGNVESSTPGVGLGLAICKAIVLAHGGEIHATNAIDGGAIFTFTLIRRTPPASTEENQLMNT